MNRAVSQPARFWIIFWNGDDHAWLVEGFEPPMR